MIVNTRNGPFEIPGGQDLISRSLQAYGEWAQQEIDKLAAFIREGDTVVDAGAFIGTHARAFSELVGASGQVHAFEPSGKALPFLERNAQTARLANITVHAFGLGETAETKRFVFEDANLGASHAVSDAGLEAEDSITIQRLDDAGLGRVNFIKADVEGMEISLLKGANAVIEQCRPLIYLELNSLEMGADALAWARQNGYLVHGLAADPFNPQNHNQNLDNIFGEALELGLLLAPAERQSEWQGEMARLGLPAIGSHEDLALLLLQKPQYASDWLAHSPTYHKRLGEVRQQLALTEQAKAEAEALVAQRHAELEALTQQLVATEQAKEWAEKLAWQRHDELNELQQKLAASEQAKNSLQERLRIIQSSRLWRLGERMGITPDIGSGQHG